MKTIYNNYIGTFKGLSHEVWWLAAISLINRAGTMIIPFLSLYLTKNLNYSKDDAGWILVCFGIGSLLGSFFGGKLTDKIGFYKVMILSLLLTGINFIILQFITSFWALCFAILIIMTIADMFRPALFVSLKAYSKPENQTRSLALIRLAINLGMGIGPTLAGFIIVTKGYNLLFWIDGLTCIIAILLFYRTVKETQNVRKIHSKNNIKNPNNSTKKISVYNDFSYWIFIGICLFMGMAFFQLIVTMPIYYEEVFQLNEFEIGLIWFINIGIIVLFEMPFIDYLEKRKLTATKLIIISCILFGLSFYVLYQNFWIGILILNMVIITFAEMLGFPYTNTFALNRAKEGIEGSYMAFYAMSFSVAHIFSAKIGLSISDAFGYQINWLVTGTYGTIATLLAIWLHHRVKQNL